MEVNYRTGWTGPLKVGEPIYDELPPDTILVTGSDPEAVTKAAHAIADAAKKKRRRMVAKSRRANRR